MHEAANSHAEKADRFRALHEQAGPFVIPNPWDIGTARLLQGLGFAALATTSAGYAFSSGRPDGAGRLSREETIAHAAAIAAAVDLPVTADLENGFGDSPEMVGETIRLAAAAGLAGGSIEDATGRADAPLYDHGRAVERIAAAAEAARAQPVPFILTARAENFLMGRPDLDDTIRRLQDYAAAGADVLYAPALPSLEAIAEVCAAVGKPVNAVVGLAGNFASVEELGRAGVRRISVGSSLARVALGGFLRAARAIQAEGRFDLLRDAEPFAALQDMMSGNS